MSYSELLRLGCNEADAVRLAFPKGKKIPMNNIESLLSQR